MALKKTYTIEIQMDAARNALADATKKLADLDAQLEGLDKDSDAGKAIVAEMAKAAKQVEQLTNEVEGLGGALDSLKPGSIGALKQQAQDLEKALEAALVGSAEADELIAELGKVKAQLKDIDEAVDVAFDKDRAGALADAASGVAGAFSLATVAAQNFGLTEEDADSYNQKLVEMLAVISSIEQVHKLTTSEVSTALKGLFGDAKKVVLGYLGIGEAATASGAAASTAGKVTKAALISTGIGVFIVLLGLVISNWDRLTASVKGGEGAWTKIKAVTSGLFSSLIAYIRETTKLLADLFTGDLSSLITDAATFGKNVGGAYSKGFSESVAESNRALLEKQAEQYDRYIQIIKAKGQDAYNVEVAYLKKRIASQKAGSKEEADFIQQLAALRAGRRKQEHDEELADVAAQLNAVASLRAAKGQDAFEQLLAVKEEELKQLLGAEIRNEAAITAKRGELASMRAAQAKKNSDAENEATLAGLNARLALLQASNVEYSEEYLAFSAQVAKLEDERQISAEDAENRRAEKLAKLQDKHAQEAFALQVGIKQKELEFLKKAPQVNAAAIIQKESEISVLLEQKREARGAFEFEAFKKRNANLEKQEMISEAEKAERLAAFREMLGARIAAGTSKKLDRLAAEMAERAAISAKAVTPLGDLILIKVFGVSADQIDIAKQRINEAYASVVQSVNTISTTLLDAANRQVDAELEAAGLKYDEVTKKLDEAKSRREADENALASAQGARREYLINKIEKERSAEQRLAVQKKRAADEQARAEKKKQDLEKESQKITAASTFAASAYNAVIAVQAALEAVKQGSKVPFPANIAAIVAGLAAVAATVVSAKNLGKTLKLEKGGLLEGPRHNAGGIPVGNTGIEVEGGEYVVNRWATAKYLPLLESINSAASVRVLPPAPKKLEQGGQLPSGLNSTPAAPAGKVLVNEADLQALLAFTKQVASNTAQLVAYGPARLGIGEPEALAILDVAESGRQIQQANSL